MREVMSSIPLHPAIVHLPLGLAAVLPVLAAVAAWAIVTDRVTVRAWFAVVGLQAVLLAGALFALKTGEADEERVEEVVAESAIEAHEEQAELFTWAAGGILGLTALGLLYASPRSRKLGQPLVYAAPIALGVQTLLAIQVGHAGGELVYTHGAAAAHVGAAGPGADAGEAAAERDDDDDDDDDD
jgi:uncharacterized membrane protein